MLHENIEMLNCDSKASIRPNKKSVILKSVSPKVFTDIKGAAMVYWLSSWLAEEDVRGSIPDLAATISEIGFLLLPSRNMADRSLKKKHKSSIQPTSLYRRKILFGTTEVRIFYVFYILNINFYFNKILF